MFDSPRTVEGPGTVMAGPPLSARPSQRSGGTSYPGFVYSFWDDNDRRCLYVGKAGAGPSGPGMRIQAHYLNRAPWALQATRIMVTPFPGITDTTLLEVERQRIEALRPRGNKQGNWRHHDRAWMMRTQQAHARAAGQPVNRLDVWVALWALAQSRARQVGRMVGQALMVDAVAVMLIVAIRVAVA